MSPAQCACIERLPWGFPPLRDTDMRSPRHNEIPTPRLRSALSVSHALDRLLLLIPRGPISSRSHVRDSLFRGFPRCPATSPHRLGVPSCRSARVSFRRVAPPVPDPLASPPGLSSGQRSVAADRRFRPADGSIPSWAFNSFGFSFRHLGCAFTLPPLMTFPALRSLSAPRRPSAFQSMPNLLAYP
jgi:hypothetical protein